MKLFKRGSQYEFEQPWEIMLFERGTGFFLSNGQQVAVCCYAVFSSEPCSLSVFIRVCGEACKEIEQSV